MATAFNLIRDNTGSVSFLRRVPEEIYGVKLSQSTEKHMTAPRKDSVKKWVVLFSYEPGDSVWVAINKTAAAPTANLAIVPGEINPVGYVISPDDEISLLTAENDGVEVSIAFYDASYLAY